MKLRRYVVKSTDNSVGESSGRGFYLQDDGTFAPDRLHAKLFLRRKAAKKVALQLGKSNVVDVDISNKMMKIKLAKRISKLEEKLHSLD